MPKKTKPRWGDHGVTEIPDFALSPEQAQALAAMLEVTRPGDVHRLKQELEEIGCFYLRWSAQDEGGPSRAERNAALREVVEASQRLELLLKALDHASEAELMDALAPYRSETREFDEDGNVKDTHQTREFGFRQIQALRDLLTHFNVYAKAFLRGQMRRRGPDRKKTLPAVVDMLAEIYERETGDRPTHTPFKGTAYMSEPQSEAGRFIAYFVKIVDPKIPPSTISSTLGEVLKKRRSKTDERQ